MSAADWLTRGRGLGCFPSQTAELAYAAAWLDGDDVLVRLELERILTRVHPMPKLNWLAHRDAMRLVDELEDAPDADPADWTDGMFELEVPGIGRCPASWLCPDGAVPGERWQALTAAVARQFLPLGGAEKFAQAAQMEERVLRAAARRGTLRELTRAAAEARFLVLGAAASEALRLALRRREAVAALAPALAARTAALAGAWHTVLGGAAPRPLTLQALRSCVGTWQLDNLLAAQDHPDTNNLITYLRCTDVLSGA